MSHHQAKWASTSSSSQIPTPKDPPSNLGRKSNSRTTRKKTTPLKSTQHASKTSHLPTSNQMLTDTGSNTRNSGAAELPEEAGDPVPSVRSVVAGTIVSSVSESRRPSVSSISLDSGNESYVSTLLDTPVMSHAHRCIHKKPLLKPRPHSNVRDDSPSHLSVDDLFVDAPETFERKTPESQSGSLIFDDAISPLRDVAELAREIPKTPPRRSADGNDPHPTQSSPEADAYPLSGPEAQIIAEVALSMPSSYTSKKRTPRSRKRKRISEALSSPVLDTIVVDSGVNSFSMASEDVSQSQSHMRRSEASDGPPSRKRRPKRGGKRFTLKLLKRLLTVS